MEIERIEKQVMALLFAHGDPLELAELSEILQVDKKSLKSIITLMNDRMTEHNEAVIIRELEGKYQLCTHPFYSETIRRLVEPRQKQGLSQAAFETLAVIAYKQPVTRSMVESIRGVNSDSAIGRLIERGLARETGRLDAPGRPALYGTTDEFLRAFGFRSIADLPVMAMNDPEEVAALMLDNGIPPVV